MGNGTARQIDRFVGFSPSVRALFSETKEPQGECEEEESYNTTRRATSDCCGVCSAAARVGGSGFGSSICSVVAEVGRDGRVDHGIVKIESVAVACTDIGDGDGMRSLCEIRCEIDWLVSRHQGCLLTRCILVQAAKGTIVDLI